MWITKSCRHNHSHAHAHIAKKGAAGKDVLDKLNSFLDAGSPEPVYFLQNMWGNQQKAITYKEIRQAVVNGHLSSETLKAWQQDYAAFVNTTMNPLWTSSMVSANTALTAKYPDFFFSPMMSGTQQWITDHGAEWVTLMTTEQRNAIAAILKTGATGQHTVDELSRLIRPCVGLTASQSAANLNYYNAVKEGLLSANPNMKLATAERLAQEASLKFAQKQHAARAYSIATTEMAFAYNVGAEEGIKQAQDQGFMGMVRRVWRTAADEGVCEICMALDGVTIDMEQEFDYKGKTLYSGQKQTPPAHPRCRCAIEYEEVEPPAFEGTDVPVDQIDTWTPPDPEPTEPVDPSADSAPPSLLQGAPVDLTPTDTVAPMVPMDISADDLGLTLGPKAHLGGTGTMYTATDADGNQWLFKPAQSKSGKAEAFRADVQVAGYKVQNIVDPSTAVQVGSGTVDGKYGAFQRRVEGVNGTVDLKAWQGTLDQLPEGVAPQLQREHVTDWLMGNYDSHGANFLLDKDGRLIGVDKEQGFKYMAQQGSQKMSYSYHPNASYGETEPIYNTMYRRFAKGEIDLNLQDSLTYIKRVEAIPDKEYREIFRGYAESLKGKGHAAEQLLDEIVDRKASLREEYRSFYSDLLTERTGKKQLFMFADEAVAKAQPISAMLHTPESLQAMSKSDLLQLAKGKKIAYYNNMDVKQLVTAISDPSQAAAMSQQVKDRLAANAAARRAAQVKPAAPVGAPKDIYSAEDVFKDLSSVPSGRYGAPVFSDRDSLEGLSFTARRVTIDGVETYELSGKLTFSKWQSTSNVAAKMGHGGPLKFEVSDASTLQYYASGAANNQIPLRGFLVRDGSTIFEILDGSETGSNGMLGFFRIRTPITASGQADAARISSLMDMLGLDDLFVNPTAEAEMIYKKSRLLWRLAPSRTRELRGLTGKKLSDKLDNLLTQEKINPKLADRMELKRVFDGYSTYIDIDSVEELKKAGLEYVWSGVGKAENVVQIVKTGGLTSTNTRLRIGVKPNGVSPVEDMRTGGSDNVFTRVAVRGKRSFSDCPFSGRYQIMIDAAETARTDWYAYDFDNFGRSNPGAMEKRKTPVEFVSSMVKSYKNSNEVMFRHGISSESFIGIACGNNSDRTSLIAKLRAEGITKINGHSIEDFIKVKTQM